MSSADPTKAALATMKAGDILGTFKEGDIDEDKIRIKHDKTVISKYSSDDRNHESMSQEGFMRSVEEDAKRRSEDKKLRNESANRWIAEGNNAFRRQDYHKALSCYCKGIGEVKDSCLLYNNRSLTYLKLGLYQKALEDSKLALYLNSNSLRALIYQANALYCLGKDEESQMTVEKACQLHPNRIHYIKELQLNWISVGDSA